MGPSYGQPGKHDWDLLDNGIYGQHNDNADFDGMSWVADVSIGRAPVSNETQATAFVEKVIAYEKFRTPDGTPLQTTWPRRMLFVSTDFWEQRFSLFPSAINPPAAGQYYHATASTSTVIQLPTAPSDLDWNLIAEVAADDVRLVPFAMDASWKPSSRRAKAWRSANSYASSLPTSDSIS